VCLKLSYRVSYLKLPIVIPWASLAMQFGSDYAQMKNFKAAFLDALRKVHIVYTAANFETSEHGLIIKPSLTHIGRMATNGLR